jgi:hypothetical protein
MTIKCERVSVVFHSFNASVIEFLQSARHSHIYITNERLWRLINSSVGRTKQGAMQLMSLIIKDIEKGVVLEEILIEDLITVLLIHITTLVIYPYSDKLKSIYSYFLWGL